ncbi:hypothetical protein TNCV_2746741 [Trichonephila clavipes]|nr:hypothetical protein TNCV_2746741 [Trichonephila clavipes]
MVNLIRKFTHRSSFIHPNRNAKISKYQKLGKQHKIIERIEFSLQGVVEISTFKFRRVVLDTTVTANHPRAWGRKLCLVGENRDNSSHREDDEPNRMLGFGGLKKPASMKILSLIPELLLGIPTTVHQNLWFMHDGAPTHFSIAVYNHLHVAYSGGGLDEETCCLISTLPGPQSFGFLLETPEISDVCEVIGEGISHGTGCLRFCWHHQHALDLFERVRQSFVRWCRLCYDLHWPHP